MTRSAKPALEVGVECYAGYRGEEAPRRFTLGRTIEVAEVLDAWLAPEHRYFKVRGDDGWELTMLIGPAQSADRRREVGNTKARQTAAKVIALCLPPVVMSLIGLAALSRKKGAAVVAGQRSAPARPAARGEPASHEAFAR